MPARIISNTHIRIDFSTKFRVYRFCIIYTFGNLGKSCSNEFL